MIASQFRGRLPNHIGQDRAIFTGRLSVMKNAERASPISSGAQEMGLSSGEAHLPEQIQYCPHPARTVFTAASQRRQSGLA